MDVDLAFKSHPMAWLDNVTRLKTDIAAIGHRKFAVTCPKLANQILRNDDSLYLDHSDFFGVGVSAFGSREAQIQVGRRGRDMIQKHLESLNLGSILASYHGSRLWPRTGNEILQDLAAGIIAAPDRAQRFNALREEIVRTRIFDREGGEDGRIKRAARRFMFYRAFSAEREQWLKRDNDNRVPRDLLDIIFEIGSGVSTDKLIEIYVAFNFSLIGSLGFALGWMIYLTIKYRAHGHSARHVLMEALRLYPIAWLLSREVRSRHSLGGISVDPGTELWVFPYAVHRRSDYWIDPDQFAPERWLRAYDRSAWIPFGSGPHSCVAISLSFQILERLWREIFSRGDPQIKSAGRASKIGAALAPPLFELDLKFRDQASGTG